MNANDSLPNNLPNNFTVNVTQSCEEPNCLGVDAESTIYPMVRVYRSHMPGMTVHIARHHWVGKRTLLNNMRGRVTFEPVGKAAPHPYSRQAVSYGMGEFNTADKITIQALDELLANFGSSATFFAVTDPIAITPDAPIICSEP